jgi:hypothetical protein
LAAFGCTPHESIMHVFCCVLPESHKRLPLLAAVMHYGI